METLSPRATRRLPRLEAVSPLPSEEATPPVTKRCLVSFARGPTGLQPISDLGTTTATRPDRARVPRPGPVLSGVRARSAYAASRVVDHVVLGRPGGGLPPAGLGPPGPLGRVVGQLPAPPAPPPPRRRARTRTAASPTRSGDAAHRRADQRQPGQQRLLGDQGPGLPGRGQQGEIRGRQQRAEVVPVPEQGDRQLARRRSARPGRPAPDPPPPPRTAAPRRSRSAAATSRTRPRFFCGASRATVSTRTSSGPTPERGPGRRPGQPGDRDRRGGHRQQPGAPGAPPPGLGHQVLAGPEGQVGPAGDEPAAAAGPGPASGGRAGRRCAS